MARQKTIYPSREIPRLWIEQNINYAANPGRVFFFEGKCLYQNRYGQKRLVAMIVQSPVTHEFAVVKTRNWLSGLRWEARHTFDTVCDKYRKIIVNNSNDIEAVKNPKGYLSTRIREDLEMYAKNYIERVNDPDPASYHYRSANNYLGLLLSKRKYMGWFAQFFGINCKLECDLLSSDDLDNLQLMAVVEGESSEWDF